MLREKFRKVASNVDLEKRKRLYQTMTRMTTTSIGSAKLFKQTLCLSNYKIRLRAQDNDSTKVYWTMNIEIIIHG